VTKRALLVLTTVAGWFCATPAAAFENQWHLGTGASAVLFAGDASYLVPSLNLHGAYGVSDVFDLRLQMATGMPLSPPQSGCSLTFAEAVVAYKLDIIEWIPWVGLGPGVFGATGKLEGRERHALQPSVGLWLGLDYAFSREWGVGGTLSLHSWVADSTRSSLRHAASQFGISIERRFGW
jgi:hypothetical protein